MCVNCEAHFYQITAENDMIVDPSDMYAESSDFSDTLIYKLLVERKELKKAEEDEDNSWLLFLLSMGKVTIQEGKRNLLVDLRNKEVQFISIIEKFLVKSPSIILTSQFLEIATQNVTKKDVLRLLFFPIVFGPPKHRNLSEEDCRFEGIKWGLQIAQDSFAAKVKDVTKKQEVLSTYQRYCINHEISSIADKVKNEWDRIAVNRRNGNKTDSPVDIFGFYYECAELKPYLNLYKEDKNYVPPVVPNDFIVTLSTSQQKSLPQTLSGIFKFCVILYF
jgi:hypothetical protein